MTHWTYRLELAELWDKAAEREATPQEVALGVVAALEGLGSVEPKAGRGFEVRRLELVEQFKDLADVPDLTYDQFDEVMHDVFDWGDSRLSGPPLGGRKLCWVNVSSRTRVSS